MAETRDPETYALIGAALEVHNQLGHGFLEAVYQEAYARELAIRNVPYIRECDLQITYKGERLACTYRADFLCYEDVIVEIKAIRTLSSVDEAQVLNYLKAAGKTRALLINFGAPSLQHKRIVLNYNRQP